MNISFRTPLQGGKKKGDLSETMGVASMSNGMLALPLLAVAFFASSILTVDAYSSTYTWYSETRTSSCSVYHGYCFLPRLVTFPQLSTDRPPIGGENFMPSSNLHHWHSAQNPRPQCRLIICVLFFPLFSVWFEPQHTHPTHTPHTIHTELKPLIHDLWSMIRTCRGRRVRPWMRGHRLPAHRGVHHNQRLVQLQPARRQGLRQLSHLQAALRRRRIRQQQPQLGGTLGQSVRYLTWNPQHLISHVVRFPGELSGLSGRKDWHPQKAVSEFVEIYFQGSMGGRKVSFGRRRFWYSCRESEVVYQNPLSVVFP